MSGLYIVPFSFANLGHQPKQIMWGNNFYVYITTNSAKKILYIGVTNDLKRRLSEHTENKGSRNSFTGKYYCSYLIYYEHYADINQAIAREKELKAWRREKKICLIESVNQHWRFLNSEF